MFLIGELMTRSRSSSTPAWVVLGALVLAIAAVVIATVVSGARWALSQPNLTPGHLKLNGPSFPAVDTHGNLYVADHANQRVVKLSPTGILLATWHRFAGFAGADNGPGPIAIDAHDSVYVASAGKIQMFSSTGNRLAVWPLGFDPQGMAIDRQGRIYLTDSDTNHIVIFSSTGTQLAVWRAIGSGPHGIAIDARGNIYVADTGSNRIEKRSSTGKLLAQWGKRGRRLGQFDRPGGVAAFGSSSVYVGDSGNDRIQMFSPQGKVLGWWGSWGTRPGQFSKVTSLFLAVDNQQDIEYVTDATANAIHKFSWDGKALAMWR